MRVVCTHYSIKNFYHVFVGYSTMLLSKCEDDTLLFEWHHVWSTYWTNWHLEFHDHMDDNITFLSSFFSTPLFSFVRFFLFSLSLFWWLFSITKWNLNEPQFRRILINECDCINDNPVAVHWSELAFDLSCSFV